MKGVEKFDGCEGPSTSTNEPNPHSVFAGFGCPRCDRPTLEATPDEITDWRCSVCDERVREVAQ